MKVQFLLKWSLERRGQVGNSFFKHFLGDKFWSFWMATT